jgi:hypothetical protein
MYGLILYCFALFVAISETSAVHTNQFWVGKYAFVSKNKQHKASIKAIITDPGFWNEVKTIVIVMFPVLKCLWLVDSNAAGMNKLYYYVHRTSEALQQTKHSFNGGGQGMCFEYCPETHTALGNVSESTYTCNLHYLNVVKHDLSFDDIKEDIYEAGVAEECSYTSNHDDDSTYGYSELSYTANGSIEFPQTLQNGLGDHIAYLWEERKSQLISNFA